MKTTEKKVRVGKVKKDKSGEEWIVPVYVDGKFNDDMTYYAGSRKSDKEDAEKTRDRMIKDFKTSKEYELEESNKKEDSIILEQDVVINQKGKKIILEKGDKIEILKEEEYIEEFMPYMNHLLAVNDFVKDLDFFLKKWDSYSVRNIQTDFLKNPNSSSYTTRIYTTMPYSKFETLKKAPVLTNLYSYVTYRKLKISPWSYPGLAEEPTVGFVITGR
jgi:hypothetical protein